jgi:hypothetical protein
MTQIGRTALAGLSSLAACGIVQQAILAADAHHDIDLLLPLAVVVAAISALFTAALWRRARIGRLATILAAALLVGAAAIYAWGVNDLSPGIGGNIGYLLARMVALDVMLPAALAAPIHWRLLRNVAHPR